MIIISKLALSVISVILKSGISVNQQRQLFRSRNILEILTDL